MQSLLPNTNLSQYRIVSKLGSGGMGEVYLAEDTRLRRRVALKVLPAEIAQDESRVHRFEQEALAASALNHPNILTIYEFGLESEMHFLASEYIDGETLRARLQRTPLTMMEALDIAAQTAQALAAAHEAKIIHRDVKPENVMIRKDGIVKVLDFGLAKLTEKPSAEVHDSKSPTAGELKTNPGTVMGTARYMSPEQARGQEVDARTDIFSLGVVLYEMLAGRPPFEGVNALDIIGAILQKEPPPLTRHLPMAPRELEHLLNKSLRKDREQRYQTVKDLLIDLKDLKEEMVFAAKQTRTDLAESKEPAAALEATPTSQPPAEQTTSSARIIFGEIKRHKLSMTLLLVLLLAGIAAVSYFASRQAGSIESIAVLPFVNESSNEDMEYLSDGMTETLISNLSRLPNLDVKPRSSVFRYKGKETSPQTIGKELKVQAILNGRVVQRGQDLSLYVELMDVPLDKVVWSEQYNRKQTDLVTLQTEIALDVSTRLKSRLSGAEEAKVRKTYTANPEAYQLYLRGNFYLTKYTEEGFRKGIEYYEKALAIDPKYALAYHSIANAYDFSNGFYLSPRESEPKAKAAALKALELDDTLAETHFLLGKIVFWYEWDWTTAEREWRRAHELDASFPVAYPPYLTAMGRFDEAVKAQDVVLQRLPLDLNMIMDSASILLAAGRYDHAIERTQKALELDPDFWWSYQVLGRAYERKKQFPEAIAALEKARFVDSNPSNSGYLGYVYATAGKKAEAERILEELKEISNRRYVDPYSIATIYAGLNDKDQALEWLNKAYEERSFSMTLLKSESELDTLRPDPRFKDLLQRMNLPQ